MTVFALVHGAFHGGWCWEEVTPLLEAAGHRAYAPDLPGLGEDRTPLAEISLAGYAGRVSELLATIAEPVVLVGHSAGGLAISQAAEYASERGVGAEGRALRGGGRRPASRFRHRPGLYGHRLPLLRIVEHVPN